MLRHARGVVALALITLSLNASAQFETNFQNLLTGLTQGTEVTLLTPLSDGTVEVTSFYPPGRMPAASAAAALEQARERLVQFGIEQPSGAQLAAALVGGRLDVPSGSTQLSGVLPAIAGRSGAFTAYVVTGQPPQTSQAPGASAAAGASAPPASAIQLANEQLAQLGIAQPTPEQVRAALEGGTVMTPSGTSITLPGIFSTRR